MLTQAQQTYFDAIAAQHANNPNWDAAGDLAYVSGLQDAQALMSAASITGVKTRTDTAWLPTITTVQQYVERGGVVSPAPVQTIIPAPFVAPAPTIAPVTTVQGAPLTVQAVAANTITATPASAPTFSAPMPAETPPIIAQGAPTVTLAPAVSPFVGVGAVLAILGAVL